MRSITNNTGRQFATASFLFRYGVAVGAAVLATLLTLLLWPFIQTSFFPLFSLAVLVSALVGGLGPGLLTTALAGLANTYFFLSPSYSLAVTADGLLKLSVFTLVAVLISLLTDRRKQAEEAERAQREYFQVTLASIGDAVIVTDPTGTMTFLNHIAEKVTGWTTADAMGKPLPEVFHIVNEETRQPVENPVAKVLRTGTVAGLANHTILIRRDGSACPIDDSAAPIRDEQRRILGVILVFRDITARRQAEESLTQQAEELQRVNDELQQFAHIVSHDLNEPLRTMNNYVQLLARRLKGNMDADATEFMTFVTDAAQRMQQMLTDLLTYTKAGQVPEFQAVDCEAVLTQVLSALQARITECEAVITHDPLPTIRGDATRLGQVLQNLIGNALKFCEVKPPRIHVSAVQEDHHWRFTVRDNGIGIDPTQAGKLFQVFQRLHSRSEYPGTGIGLAICKKIIEQHGGRIWVDSQPDEGSIFNFTIKESSQHSVVSSQ